VQTIRYQTGHSFWMYSFHHALRYGEHSRCRLAHAFDPLASVAPLIGFTGFDRQRANARGQDLGDAAHRPEARLIDAITDDLFRQPRAKGGSLTPRG
jgi:hypothetical protein